MHCTLDSPIGGTSLVIGTLFFFVSPPASIELLPKEMCSFQLVTVVVVVVLMLPACLHRLLAMNQISAVRRRNMRVNERLSETDID